MKRPTQHLTRRSFLQGVALCGAFLVTGCSPSKKEETTEAQQPEPVAAKAGAAQATSMTVYRDPSCGCCGTWAELARKAGYQVALVDDPKMPAVKQKHGVPEALSSCHTAIVGGYAIEGHVPLEDVKRLLAERPSGIRGIAVPGMPRGSPGMEMPDGSKDSFKVIAFDAGGTTSVFSA